MSENDSELAKAASLCRQNGFTKAALILGKAWANELKLGE
jgi:hypothetical protein